MTDAPMVVEVGERTVTKRARTAEAARRLVHEAAVLASVVHPGVVAVVGPPLDGHDPVLVTARATGHSLDRHPAPSARTVSRVGAAAATIVADLHDLGWCHGALDRSHLVVDGERVVVCSLGRATPMGPEGAAEDCRRLAAALLAWLDGAATSGDRAERRERESLRAVLAADIDDPRRLADELAGVTSPNPADRHDRRVVSPRAPDPGASAPAERLVWTPGDDPGPRRAAGDPATDPSADDADPDAGPLPVARPVRRVRGVPLPARRTVGSAESARRWPAGAVLAGAVLAVVALGGLAATSGPSSVPSTGAALGDAVGPVRPAASPVPTATATPTATASPTAAAPSGAPPPLVAGHLVRHDGRWFEAGRPGDIVAIGDWRCTGTATPAVLRPATGAVFVFDRWADTEPIEVAPASHVSGAVTIEAGIEACGGPWIRDATGRLVEVRR